MRKIFTFVLLVALPACSREVAPRQHYTMTIGASKVAVDPTKALSIDDSGIRNVLNATWTAGDEVTVYKISPSSAPIVICTVGRD